MPKGKKGNPGTGPRQNQPDRVGTFITKCSVATTRYSGSLLIASTLVAGANVLQVNPEVFGTLFSSFALQSFSSLFTEYRFTKIALRIWPQVGNVSVSYNPEVVATPATTIANAIQSPYSILSAGASLSSVPQTLVLNRSVLMSGAPKWWKCKQTADADNWDEIQGSINLVAATGTPSMTVEMYFNIEFTSVSGGQAGNSEPFSRRNMVRDPSQAVINLVVLGKPYPKDVSLDEEWVRVKQIHEKSEEKSKRELARLMAL